MNCLKCRFRLVIVGLLFLIYMHYVHSQDDILDIACFSYKPRVTDSEDSNFHGYALRHSRTADITLGILNDQRSDLRNVSWDDIDTTGALRGTVFPDDSEVPYWNNPKFKRLGITIKSNRKKKKVGVFSFEAKEQNIVTRSSIVIISKSATVNFEHKSLTVGVGESVNLTINDQNNIRWRHNHGDVIEKWNDKQSVTITNVRAEDDGVYECYHGDSPDGNQGIMRLIVRDCPSPKWNPPQCEMDCPVCYNGGVCDDKLGVCICTPGFTGTHCEAACGKNRWGQDCLTVCSSRNNDACRGTLICPPNPAGCSCSASYTGLDCTTDCPDGYYGSNCRSKCNCANDKCNKANGCESNCDGGFKGPQCQVSTSDHPCAIGYFGELCNYHCHCKGSTTCNRADGSCGNYDCEDSWAGSNCSIALPYLSKPPIVIKQTATSVAIDVSWTYGVDFGTGEITKCRLWYKLTDLTEWKFISSTDDNVLNVTGLNLKDRIEFYAQHSRLVGTEELNGPRSPRGNSRTICSEPLISPSIQIKSVFADRIDINVQKLDININDIQCDGILYYQVQYGRIDGSSAISNTTDDSTTNTSITNLLECVEYSLQSRVINSKGFSGPWSISLIQRTGPSEAMIQKNAIIVRENSVFVRWDIKSCIQEENVTYFYQVKQDDSILSLGYTKATEVLIYDNIQPCTNYRFEVFASFQNFNGTTDNEDVLTMVAYPGIPIISDVSSTSSSITVFWFRPVDNPCIITLYNLSVMSNDTIMSATTTELYITIEDNILPNVNYEVKVAAMTLKGYGNFSEQKSIRTLDINNPNTGIIVGSVSGSILVILMVILFYCVIIKRKRHNEKLLDEGGTPANDGAPGFEGVPENAAYETIDDIQLDIPANDKNGGSDSEVATYNKVDSLEPIYSNTSLQDDHCIAITDLHSYVLSKNSDPVHNFHKEFEDLGNTQLHPWSVAKSSVNQTKNRYANIIPYDNSRVILQSPQTIPGSDYINASYLDGYVRPRQYIACQGPNKASVNDMWRMIWQENSTVIVMVTNVREKNKKKSEKYWPDKNMPEAYGDITVTNSDEKYYDDYVIRELKMTKPNSDDVHTVWHYQFTTWPDKSVPTSVRPFVEFIKKFKDGETASPKNSGPLIVHCSAGAGRTGTVITIANMLEMAQEKGCIDVYNFVRSMRDKRIQMVQTEGQYRYIYEVLLEVLFCENTTIPAMDLAKILGNIKSNRNKDRKSAIDQQLMTLKSLLPAHPLKALVSVGISSENISRNRFPDVTPLNRARVLLVTPYSNDSDYINASMCDGYRRPNAFITTQSPLSVPDTSADFWSMVFDYESHIIVVLNKIEDKSYAKYMPKQVDKQLSVGQYIVQLESYTQIDAVVEQKLVLQKGKAKREIFNFVYTQWQRDDKVPDTDSFLNLISTVEQRQRSCKGFPAVVICQNGAERCGLYCAVSSIIQKIKEETLVDVYETVKRLRKSCPNMITTMEQYTFCYDAALRFLDGSQVYENVH